MRTLASTDSDKPQAQRAAICYSQWRNESIHPDFQRIMQTFAAHFKDGNWLERFQRFIDGNRLDLSKPYNPAWQFRESFQWLKPLIEFYKHDEGAKYYKVTFLTAHVSMNNNDYSNWTKLMQAAPSLSVKPVNINHDHERWLPFPRTRIDTIGAEDMSVEGVLRVDDEDAWFQQKLDNEEIRHPSIEGYRKPDGVIEFQGAGFLEQGVDLPGDPLTEIVPLILNESVRTQLCKTVDGKTVCEPCLVEPSATRGERKITENKTAEVEKPHPNDERDTKILRLSEQNLKLQEDGNKARSSLIEAQTLLSEKNRLLAEKERRIIELEALEPQVKLRDGNILELEQELLTAKKKYEAKVNELAAIEKQYIEDNAKLKQRHIEETTLLEKQRDDRVAATAKYYDDKLASTIKQHEEKIQAITTELESTKKISEDYKVSTNMKHESEKKDLADRVALLTKTVEAKEIDAKQLMENVTRLQGQNDGLRKDVQLFTAKATEANESSRKAKQELIEIQTQNAGLMDENARITDKNNELTKQFTGKVKEHYANSQENEKLVEHIKQLEETLDAVRIQNKKMNKTLTAAGFAWVDKDGNVAKES